MNINKMMDKEICNSVYDRESNTKTSKGKCQAKVFFCPSSPNSTNEYMLIRKKEPKRDYMRDLLQDWLTS